MMEIDSFYKLSQYINRQKVFDKIFFIDVAEVTVFIGFHHL